MDYVVIYDFGEYSERETGIEAIFTTKEQAVDCIHKKGFTDVNEQGEYQRPDNKKETRFVTHCYTIEEWEVSNG